MTAGLLYLVGIFNELMQPPHKQHYFLATGKTRETLAQAQDAIAQQQALEDKIKERFGAEHVRLSNIVEQTHWEGMKEGQGFKLYFKKGQQPEGWYVPESWGDRQHYHDTNVYLPPKNSDAAAFMKQAGARLDAITALPPGQPEKRDISRDSGTFYWNNIRAKKALNAPDNFYVEDSPPPGVHLVYLSSREDKVTLPPHLSDCLPISGAEAAAIKNDPEGALQRADRVEHGKNAQTFFERSRAALHL